MEKVESKNIKITNTYVPGQSSFFAFRSSPDEESTNQIMEPVEEVKEANSILQVGVASAKTKNHLYKNMISEVGVWSLSNEAIIDCFRQFLGQTNSKLKERDCMEYKYSKFIEWYNENIKQFITNKFEEGWSIRKLVSIWGIEESILRTIINEFKF